MHQINKPTAPHRRRHRSPAASSSHDLDSQEAAPQALAPQSPQARGTLSEGIHDHTSSIHVLPPHTKHHRCCIGRSGAGSLQRVDLQRVDLALAPKTLPLQRPPPALGWELPPFPLAADADFDGYRIAAHVAKGFQNIHEPPATTTSGRMEINKGLLKLEGLAKASVVSAAAAPAAAAAAAAENLCYGRLLPLLLLLLLLLAAAAAAAAEPPHWPQST